MPTPANDWTSSLAMIRVPRRGWMRCTASVEPWAGFNVWACIVKNWVAVGPVGDFPDGIMVPCRAGHRSLLVLHRPPQWHAFDAVCPHMSRPLADAHIDGNRLECIWHNMIFDLNTGSIQDDSGFMDIPDLSVYPVIVAEERVWAQIS